MKIAVITIPADDQEQNQGSLVSNLSQLQAKGDGVGRGRDTDEPRTQLPQLSRFG
jgi:hypothetical protein